MPGRARAPDVLPAMGSTAGERLRRKGLVKDAPMAVRDLSTEGKYLRKGGLLKRSEFPYLT